MGIGVTPPKIPCFVELAEQDSIFDKAMNVMAILAANGLGLGEVLRDYAQQTYAQMSSLMQACGKHTQGTADDDTVATLASAHAILSSAATVLDMTPAAMARNKAEMLGGSEKISRDEIVRVARAFRMAPEIRALTESEEACALVLQKALAMQAHVNSLTAVSGIMAAGGPLRPA